ncbi:MAG: DUF1588 domain-containing protein [Mariniblastus sp.]|nr:DUF1588 domain-containing protein [Mariniblastus sp.]
MRPPPTNRPRFRVKERVVRPFPLGRRTVYGLTVWLVLTPGFLPAEDERLKTGQLIYDRQCAECHGPGGAGVEGAYEARLIGDESIGQLTERIAATMPEGEPEACRGEEAAAVAAYIHHTFYSPAARVRNRPPRVELARLTADQLRQSLADLYAAAGGAAGGTPGLVAERGLRGEYYNAPHRKKDEIKLERVDPTIDFDWGDEGPGAEINPEEFYVEWNGGLKIDETGRYEIIVRGSCSFVVDFGHEQRRLIDNHVQSGDRTEFRETLHLTAGRIYPFRIEFRQRKRKTEQPPARISLHWVPPGGVEQTIPTDQLVPVRVPPVFPLQTDLPPDDRSYGYERGIAISRQWDDAITAAAIEFAEITTAELWPADRRRHRNDPDEDRSVLRQFLADLLTVAFRGPLSDAQRQQYIDQQLDQAEDDTLAIKRVLLMAIKSPRFLYPLADSHRDRSHQAASRLALTLHDSLPSDRWLTRLTEQGKLDEPKRIRQAAERMVDDYRTRAKTRTFLYGWLQLEEAGPLDKDSQQFPGFEPLLVADLQASLDRLLDEIVWSEESDYRQLFQNPWTFTTPRMAEFYGDAYRPTAGDEALSRTSDNNGQHRGLLTHPYLLSRLAYHNTSSPIHRGVFLLRHVLGRTIRPPMEAFAPISPDLHPDLTTRQRVDLQTGAGTCATCHQKINGLGFTLENFDAVGRYRIEERAQRLDATGQYVTTTDQTVTLDGVDELARFLATSQDAQRAFVRRAFQHFVKQPPAAFGPETLDQLTESFAAQGYSIRQLLVEIAVVAATENRTVNDRRPDQGS